MIKIDQLLINPTDIKDLSDKEILQFLKDKASGFLGISKDEISDFSILKRSIDARKKPDVFFSFSVAFSAKRVLHSKRLKAQKYIPPKKFKIKTPVAPHNICPSSPVVIGFGPAGIAAAFTLAKLGRKPLIIERGSKVETRQKQVNRFWEGSALNVNSNVQFGEGGAGAFSDGKLNTGNKDRDGIKAAVLSAMIEHGANPEIAFDAKPHIGTDKLCEIVKNFREEIIRLGGSFMFDTTFCGLEFDDNPNGIKKINSVNVIDQASGKMTSIKTDTVFLAIGHSARDTVKMLSESGLFLEAKPFAVGYRVIHPQEYINKTQYGSTYAGILPAAPYKLTYQAGSGRAVYSFCMCPGGFVVNASSEEGRLCVNGMSYSKRDGLYANSAIVMSISPGEIPGADALRGMHYIEEIEQKTFLLADGKIPYTGKITDLQNAFKGDAAPLPNMIEDNLILSSALNFDYREAMAAFEKRIPGFDTECLGAAGIESRTSSPVRITRDESFQAKGISGLYPIGEGAGYAGGIMSAAIDGVRAVYTSISS